MALFDPKEDGWISIDDGQDGVGAQVWVAYPNPHHPDGWNLRVQWTPIQPEHAVAPLYWRPLDTPTPPTASGGPRWERIRAAIAYHEREHGKPFPFFTACDAPECVTARAEKPGSQ